MRRRPYRRRLRRELPKGWHATRLGRFFAFLRTLLLIT